MITNGDISRNVSTILNDSIVADWNLFITNQGGSIPDGGLFTGWNLSDDGSIWSDEISLFELRFVILKRKISQTGYHSVFRDVFALYFGTSLVKSLTETSEDRAGEFLLDVDHDFVNDVFHFSLLIFDDL